jgi:hypothetical protein
VQELRDNMNAVRVLTPAERRLVEGLLRAGNRLDLVPDVEGIMVAEMADGGMGSLLLSPPRAERSMSAQLSEARFVDADGVSVSATLNLDGAGALFELDIWKVDFSPLQRLPGDGDVVEFHFQSASGNPK